jgi:hypothetical protein
MAEEKKTPEENGPPEGWAWSHCGIAAPADCHWAARAIWQPRMVDVTVREVRGKALKRPRRESRYDGFIDMVWNRQGCIGDDEEQKKAIVSALNGGLVKRMTEILLQRYVGGDSGEWNMLTSGGFTLVCTPNRSCGYLYMAAYRSRDDDPNRARATAVHEE